MALVVWLGATAVVTLVLANLAGAESSTARGSFVAPPVSTSPPTVKGAALEGQLLQAAPGRWLSGPTRVHYAYQWQRCGPTSVSCSSIASATDSIYALRHEDVGASLRVVVTATNAAGSASALSRRTAVVAFAPAGAPVNSVRPTIGGKLLKGSVLAAVEGTWAGNKADRIGFSWRRCDEDGGSCSPMHATRQSYALRQADVGHTLRVLVRERNSVGTGTALSLPTGVVGPVTAPAVRPRSVSPPAISGSTEQGQTLTASSGSWAGTKPITFTFSWRRCNASGNRCATVRGANQQTYTLESADVRHTLRVAVAATNVAGSSTAVSRSTKPVSGPSAPTRPTNVGEPRISGTPRVGNVLTATSGIWTGTEPITYAYRWRRCTGRGRADASDCPVIGGATSTTYALTSADVGFRLRVQVTATNRAGSSTAASNPTDAITWGKPANTVPPSITGTAMPGRTLHADRGRWVGKQPIAYSFQWLRCDAQSGNNCNEIPGATGTDYRVGSSDAGRSLRVRVTARNDGGSQSVVSAFRNVVGGSVPPPPSGGVITLPSGEKSIRAVGVPNTARLIVSQVVFSPRPVRSAVDPITVRIRVKDTRGYVVRDALVFIRSTPRVTSGGDGRRTATDGWVTYQLVPNANFPRPRSGYNVQFFVKAYRAGDPALAGVAAYRLVQVPLAG